MSLLFYCTCVFKPLKEQSSPDYKDDYAQTVPLGYCPTLINDHLFEGCHQGTR